MTRINLVQPKQLTNKHLMAEYRELPRIFTAVSKLQSEGKTPSDVDIPESYRLGAGHCKFFYNKLAWVAGRYIDLFDELTARGFKVDSDLYAKIVQAALRLEGHWFNHYEPTPKEVYTNMYRIAVRHFKTNDVLFEGESK